MGFQYQFRGNTEGNSLGAKLFGSLFGLFFIGIPLFIGTMGTREMVRDLEARKWTPTPFTIQEVEVEKGREQYTLRITYRYEVGGGKFEGKDITRDDEGYGFESVSEKKGLLSRFPEGGVVTGYVNPDNAAESLLIQSGSWWVILGLCSFCSIFVVVGLAVIVGVWKTGSGPQSRSAATQEGEMAKKGLPLFGLIFLAIGLILPWFTFGKPFLKQQAAQQWKEVPAEVTHSAVRSHRGDDSTTYSVYIAYQYRINGEIFEGDRYQFGGGSSSGYDGKKRIVNQYPVGKEIMVYVDPENPAESVIDRRLSGMLFLGLIPLVFALVGGAIVIAAMKSNISGSGVGRSPSRMRGGNTYAALPGENETEFKPSGSRFGRLIGVTVFALIWNGIVSIFVIDLVKEWMNGRKPIFETLFFSIFVLVGLGAILGILYEFLRLLTPRVEILHDRCIFFPGASESVGFRITAMSTGCRN